MTPNCGRHPNPPAESETFSSLWQVRHIEYHSQFILLKTNKQTKSPVTKPVNCSQWEKFKILSVFKTTESNFDVSEFKLSPSKS